MLTGGLLLVAKNPAVVPILNRQLTSKTLRRDYLATVDLNKEIPDQGIIDLPIGQDPADQRKRQVRADGLRAVSHFQVLEKDEEKKQAKLLVTLETGRTHQIRVHLSASGWPIVGDPLYNPNFAGEDLALTGWQLTFVKPYSFNQVAVRLDKK